MNVQQKPQAVNSRPFLIFDAGTRDFHGFIFITLHLYSWYHLCSSMILPCFLIVTTHSPQPFPSEIAVAVFPKHYITGHISGSLCGNRKVTLLLLFLKDFLHTAAESLPLYL